MRKLFTFLAVAVAFSSCLKLGTKLTYKKGELYYTENVTKAEAEKLGNYLVTAGFFTDDHAITSQVDRKGDTVLFRFVVQPAYIDKEDYVRSTATFCTELSEKVFENKPVAIHYCDDKMKTKKIVYPIPAPGSTGLLKVRSLLNTNFYIIQLLVRSTPLA